MAVDSGSASKQSVSRNEKINSPQKKESKSQKPSGSVENFVISSPSKRNKSPGVWLMGGRIYDPVNGKTCHQEAAVSPRKRGKENSFDGKVDANLLNPIGMKSKEAKAVKNGNIDNDASLKRIGNEGKIMQEQPEEIRHHRGIIDVLTRENGSASREKKAKKTKRDRSDGMNNRTGDKVNLKENEVRNDVKKLKTASDGLAEKDFSNKNEFNLARRTSPRKLDAIILNPRKGNHTMPEMTKKN